VQRRSFLTLAALAAAPAGAKMRGMQMHLSCGAIGVKADQRQSVELAAKYGYDAVDANGSFLGGLSDGELQDFLGWMKSKNVGWALAGLNVDFRGEDAPFREGLAKFPAYCKSLQRAKVTRMTTWVLPASDTLTYIRNFKQHAARLREIARVLNDNGLRFGLEYVAPRTSWINKRYLFQHTMAETLDLIAEIGQPNVGMVLDSWHWYHAGDTGADIAKLSAKDVVTVDLNDAPAGVPKEQMMDNHRELPAATGVIDVKAFLGGLEKIGYDGPVRAEPFNDAVRALPPDQACETTMSALKKAFAS
jgi:sugar phosphate isomerase/epimerase